MKVVITKQAILDEMGISRTLLDKWIKKGMPVLGDKKYDIDAIKEWKKKNIRKWSKKREFEQKILALKQNTDMSTNAIATSLGVNHSRVKAVLTKYEIYKPDIEKYRAAKADYFAMEQLRYLDNISDEKLGEAPARDLAAMAKMAWEKERVERGESTDNVAVIVQHIKELKAKRDQEEGDPNQ